MRSLVKSNRHFRQALAKLPLGVASNFRYWGDEQTIYVRRGKGGRVRYDLEGQFGAKPEAVRERFGFYFDRFPVRVDA